MDINIPKNCTNAYVLFSGGVDSTLLLYCLLLKKKEHPNLNIVCYGFDIAKNGVRHDRCKVILGILEKKFQTTIPFFCYHRKFFIGKFVENILSVNSGYVFSGCNLVLNFLTPANYIAGDTPPVRGNPYNDNHIRPFILMDKKDIINYYVHYEILDILNLTYSCGFNLEIPCENCYFCLERAWGMEMSNINSINSLNY